MPDTYVFTGSDGKQRSFVGDRPPTPQEMTDLEKSEAPPAAPRKTGELNRQDRNILGFAHEKVQQGIANWASKLPETYRKPAAFLATLPADMLGSLAEILSAPETVATAGAGALKPGNPTPVTPLPEPSMSIPSVKPVLRFVGKGLREYDVTKPAKPIGDFLQWLGEDTNVKPTIVPSIRPSAPTEAPIASGQSVRPSFPITPAELQAAQQLAKEGVEPADIIAALQHQRASKALSSSPSFANLPTSVDVAKSVAARNSGGSW